MKLSMGSGKVRLDLNKFLVPTIPPDDFSQGVFCLKLSPQWFGLLMGLTDILLIRSIWDFHSKEQWSDIRRWVESLNYVECGEECPECPECPENPSGGGGGCGCGGGCGQVGMLGLTLEQLESYVMGCLDISNSIKMGDDGIIYVRSCDGWVPMSGMSAPVQNTGTVAPSEISFLDWIEKQFPALPPVPSIPHQNDAYNTTDSIKCAKATALVEEIYQATGSLVEAVDLFDIGTPTVTEVAAILVGLTQSLGWAAVLAIAATIYNTLSEVGIDGTVEAMQAFLENEDDKSGLICALVPQMSADEAIVDSDVKAAVFEFGQVVTLDSNGGTSLIWAAVKAFPAYYWKQTAAGTFPNMECGCENYLPYGYVPPVEVGKFNFVKMSGVGGSVSLTAAPSGTDLESVDAFAPIGSRVGNTGFRTQYRGQTGTSTITYYSAFAVLMTVPEGVSIQEIKMDVSVFAALGGGTKRLLWRGYHPVDGWVADDDGLVVDGDNNPQVISHAGLSGDGFTHLWVSFQISGVSSPGIYATVPEILISGTVNGVGFLEKTIGEVLV